MPHKCKAFHELDEISCAFEIRIQLRANVLPSRAQNRAQSSRSVESGHRGQRFACGRLFRGDDLGPMRIALFEPDIPQNGGALIRLAACMGLSIDIIEPCGFLFSDRAFRRAGMDYLEEAAIVRHASWEAFLSGVGSQRIVLLTVKAAVS